MTEQTYEVCEIPIYSVNNSRKFKDIQAGLLFNLCETSVTCRMVENVRNIVVFDSSRLFSSIIASTVVCIWFLGIVV